VHIKDSSPSATAENLNRTNRLVNPLDFDSSGSLLDDGKTSSLRPSGVRAPRFKQLNHATGTRNPSNLPFSVDALLTVGLAASDNFAGSENPTEPPWIPISEDPKKLTADIASSFELSNVATFFHICAGTPPGRR